MVAYDLPQHTTPFIGRTAEIAEIGQRLGDPQCRLLTLVGPGGIGKTRLAIEVASRQPRRFPDGIYFVELQPVASVDAVVPTIASTVGFQFYDGRDPSAQLLHHLNDKCLLLILDNYEHLLPATGLIEYLLQNAPPLKLLVTSREALNLRDEWLFQVEGMPYPQGALTDTLDAYSAVKLFVERARRARHDFSLADETPHVVRVCQLVDGIPLGLELAATWLRRMPCRTIVEEIERGLDILETDLRGVSDRHRSMRAVFDHSWQLLDREERSVLMGLSVFRGGCRREAAEQVTGATRPILAALVDKSVLRVSSNGRYEIHELQRQYAEEQLDAKPQDKTRVRDRHCAYFMNRPTLDFIGKKNQATLQEIDADIDNVRAAWNWAVEHRRVKELFKASFGVYYYSWMHSWYQEVHQCFRDGITSLRTAEPTDECMIVLGRLLALQGHLHVWFGRLQQAREALHESVAILRRLDTPSELVYALGGLGNFFNAEGNWEKASSLLHEAVALAEEIGEDLYGAYLLNLLGGMYSRLGQYAASEDYQRQALALGQKTGDQRAITNGLSALGNLALMAGDYPKARAFFEQSLRIAETHELIFMTIGALDKLGLIASCTGEHDTAEGRLRENLTLARDYGVPWAIAMALASLAQVLVAQGQNEEARAYFQEAREIAFDTADRQQMANVQSGLGDLAFESVDYASAHQHYTGSLAYHKQNGNRSGVAFNLVALGRVALAEGNLLQAAEYLLESLRESVAIQAPPVVLRTIAVIAELYVHQGNLLEAAWLAALVVDHPASDYVAREQGRQVLAALEMRCSATDIAVAVQRAADSEWSAATTQLIDQLAAQVRQPLLEPLSERELEVLRHVAAGKSNRQIADELIVTPGTVKSHVHHIIQKLDARNRTEAVTRARNLHLI